MSVDNPQSRSKKHLKPVVCDLADPGIFGKDVILFKNTRDHRDFFLGNAISEIVTALGGVARIPKTVRGMAIIDDAMSLYRSVSFDDLVASFSRNLTSTPGTNF